MASHKKKPKVALLGPAGSFSHVAWSNVGKSVKKYEKKFHKNFSAVFEAVEKGAHGFVPVFNKIIGKVPEVWNELQKGLNKKWKIIKKAKIPVSFVIAGKKNIKLSEISHLYTSNVAYLQCKKFLKKNLPLAKIERGFASTSLAAKKILKSKNKGVAVLVSSIAAKVYKLKVLAKNIQDKAGNWTEFVLFKKKDTPQKRAKASLRRRGKKARGR